jgi:adenylate cyclase
MLVTGCVGSGERLEFTVLGDTVNTAARLEVASRELGVEIVVSAASAAMAARDGALIPPLASLGDVALPGRTGRLGVLVLASENAGLPATPAAVTDSEPA